MENITLLPARVNNTIFKAQRKDCAGGCIILEDRVTDYCLSISDTTNVTVDTSLLNIPTNSSIEFNLIVVSNQDNVLNFTGFDIEQIEVHRGESTFKVRKILGSEKWTIEVISLSGYQLEKINNVSTHTYEHYFYGLMSLKNLYRTYDGNDIPYFNSDCDIGSNYNWWSHTYNGSGDMAIEMMFATPVLLKIFYTAARTDTDEFWRYPSSFVWYGSNDRVNWTQILNTGRIRYSTGSQHKFDFEYQGFFKYFKAKLRFDNTTSGNYRFIPFVFYGYKSYQTIAPKATFKPVVPYITQSSRGYNVLVNYDQMSEQYRRGYWLTYGEQGYGDDCYNVRSNNSIDFKVMYVLPKPKRIYGFTINSRAWEYTPAMTSLFVSNDGLNWKEILKKDLFVENDGQGFNLYQRRTFWVDSKKEYSYYKFQVSRTANNGNMFRILGLMPQTIEDGDFKNYDSLIPQMKANSQDGYMLIPSNSSVGDAYRMFDGNDGTLSGGSFVDGSWSIVIMLPRPEVVRGIWFKAFREWYDRVPKEFKIQGSNNNATWTDIADFNLHPNEWNSPNLQRAYEFENDTAYTYYRLWVTRTCQGTSDVRICDMGLTTESMEHGIQYNTQENLIPIMSSNEQDGYIATAKTQYSNTYAPWKAFNGTSVNGDDGWAAADNAKSDGNKNCDTWIQIQLPAAVAANGLYLRERTGCGGQDPRDFTLKGSNDGETWTTLLTQTDQSYTEKTWKFENETEYSYYRLCITKINEANTHISIGIMNLLRVNTIYSDTDADYYDYQDSIPQLNSNSQDGYEVSASDTLANDYPAWKAFNNSGSWVSAKGNVNANKWIQIYNNDGISTDCIQINWHGDFYSLNYVIEGSNDGETYTTIVSVENKDKQVMTHVLDQTYTYKYWRVRNIIMYNQGGETRMEINTIRFVSIKDISQVIKPGDEYLIPIMNSDSMDGYEATASSYLLDDADYNPYKAFTRKVGLGGDSWFGDLQSDSETFACDEWLQIQLPVAKVCNKIIMINPVTLAEQKPSAFPKNFTFEGSNDGENWDTLLTQTDQRAIFVDPNVYEFDNETAYTYYRLCITKTNGQYYPGVGQLFLLHREIAQPVTEPEEEEEQEEGGEGQGEENNNEESNVSEGE